MNNTLTAKQDELKRAIEARGDFLKANWWFGRSESRKNLDGAPEQAQAQ